MQQEYGIGLPGNTGSRFTSLTLPRGDTDQVPGTVPGGQAGEITAWFSRQRGNVSSQSFPVECHWTNWSFRN